MPYVLKHDKVAGRPGGLVVNLILLALVLEFESHRDEILTKFAKKKKKDQLLRTPSSVGRHSSTRSRRGKKMLDSSRDQNGGTYRSGEGGGGPAM